MSFFEKIVDDGVLTLKMTGDFSAAEQGLLHELWELDTDGVKKVVFDFSPVEYFSSMHVGALATFSAHLKEIGIEPEAVNLVPFIEKLLKSAGVDIYLKIN